MLTLPQQERTLLPFFPTRNIGVSVAVPLDGGRMRWAAGAFNDWLKTGEPFSRNATVYASRLTRLMWESPSKNDYLHLGVGWRSSGSDDGMVRFSGRPESNVTDKSVDTGKFAGKRAEHVSLEALVSRGRFSVLSEYFGAWVDAPESGDPFFSGCYLAGSWFVTGESRPYLRDGGTGGSVRLKRRLGAVGLVAKYSRLDLQDGGIDGGVLGKWHYGVNWWASPQWKLGLSYGDADLDRVGLRGNTKMRFSRVQWLW